MPADALTEILVKQDLVCDMAWWFDIMIKVVYA